MRDLFPSLARAIGQLGDGAILRVLAKTIGITLAVFAVLAVAGHFALQAFLERFGLFAGFEYTFLLTVVVVLVAGWLMFRIVALAVLQFFADEVVLAVEAKHFPAAFESARALPFREDLRNSLKGLVRALGVNLLVLPLAILLLFTGIGTALVFWAANGWLLGRELHDMVWLRHRSGSDDTPAPEYVLPVGSRFLLGGAVAALMLVPFLNLLAPIIGAATATHMVHRRRLADMGRA